MSDLVVDRSVVANWILPEAGSAKAHALVTTADEPLFNTVRVDFQKILLLRDFV